MELKGMIPHCVRRRQLEEMFADERNQLRKLMNDLDLDSLDDITIEQLNEVMGVFQYNKKGLNEPAAEYFVIKGKHHPEYFGLVLDYSEAIGKIKHFINIKAYNGEI